MAEEQDSIDTEAPHSNRKGAGKLIAAVAILTLLAILLVPRQQEPAPPAGTPSTEPAPQGGAPSLLSPATTAGEAPPADADIPGEGAAPTPEPASGPGAEARRLIRELRSSTPPDLERAYRAAQTFDHAGQVEDAYLMYFFAAREGHGPSAMALAREADPASFRNNGLFAAPNDLQANKWYQLAAQTHVPGAAEALTKLRSRVEKQARAGDQQARRTMLQWK